MDDEETLFWELGVPLMQSFTGNGGKHLQVAGVVGKGS